MGTGGGVNVSGVIVGAKDGEHWLGRRKISGCRSVLIVGTDGTTDVCERSIRFATSVASAELGCLARGSIS